jgi:hypothetical protein
LALVSQEELCDFHFKAITSIISQEVIGKDLFHVERDCAQGDQEWSFLSKNPSPQQGKTVHDKASLHSKHLSSQKSVSIAEGIQFLETM